MIHEIEMLSDADLRMTIGGDTRMNRGCCLTYLRNRGVKYIDVHPMQPPAKRFTQYFDVDAVAEPKEDG